MHRAHEHDMHIVIRHWAAEISQHGNWTVETILTTAENLLAAFRALDPYGPRARALLAAEARISRSTMAKLEAIGRNATSFRQRMSNLPPHLSSLYALTTLPYTQFQRALARDLRAMTCFDIMRRFRPDAARRPLGSCITIALPPDMPPEVRGQVMAKLRDSIEAVAKDHGYRITVRRRKANASGKTRLPECSPRALAAG